MKPLDNMIKSIDDNVQDILNDLFLKDSYKYDKLKQSILNHAKDAKESIRAIRYNIEARDGESKVHPNGDKKVFYVFKK